MSVPYNLTGTARKALVQTISEILGKPAVYQGAPTFAYHTRQGASPFCHRSSSQILSRWVSMHCQKPWCL